MAYDLRFRHCMNAVIPRFLLLSLILSFTPVRADEAPADVSAVNATAAVDAEPTPLADDTADREDEAGETHAPATFGPGPRSATRIERNEPVKLPILRFVVSLTVVIGLLAVFMIFLQKINRRYQGTSGHAIRVISRTHLDNKNYLALVSVHKDEYLVGVGANGISVLARTEPDDISGNGAGTSHPTNTGDHGTTREPILS